MLTPFPLHRKELEVASFCEATELEMAPGAQRGQPHRFAMARAVLTPSDWQGEGWDGG